MTIATTADRVTYTGNGSNTNWSYAFLIPEAANVVVTVTTIADSTTEEIISSAYNITGLGDDAGGIVTYPTSGPALSSAYRITIQRVLPEVQETDLVNQSGYYPEVVEDALDYLMMCVQQLQGDVNQALAFPVGADSDDDTIAALMAAILNGAANATAAAASAAEAEQAKDDILALLPLQTANIGDSQVTAAKLATDSVTAIKLADSAIGQALGMVNGTLVASVAANALTVAVKTLAGADPSTTDPVHVIFRDATIATGNFSVISLTAATSFVVSSGSTLGSVSAIPFRLWIVGFNDTGVFRLGAINCSVATQIYPLDASSVQSSTAEGGAGAADSAGVFYTGTAASSKAIQILGYLDFSAGQATAGTWATAPDKLQLFGPGVKLPGEIVQVKYMTTTSGGTTASATYAAISNSPSLAITPVAPPNKVELTWFGNFGNASQSTMAIQVVRGVTQIGPETGALVGAGFNVSLGNQLLDNFLNASSVTYSFFGKTSAGTLQFPGGNMSVSMVLKELQG